MKPDRELLIRQLQTGSTEQVCPDVPEHLRGGDVRNFRNVSGFGDNILGQKCIWTMDLKTEKHPATSRN